MNTGVFSYPSKGSILASFLLNFLFLRFFLIYLSRQIHICAILACAYVFVRFKFCKSVHHRTIQINHQSDATIFQSIILTFIYSSTCFGRSPTHHQEFNDCSGSLWFYLRIVVIAVLCLWSGGPEHDDDEIEQI